ncbi:MAG: START domain-containing protein [Bacteroidota bacterium]
MRYKGCLIILSVFLMALQPVGDWHLKKNSKEIAVYVRKSENSSLKELRAVTQQKTSLSSIVALLNDWETYPQWVYKCGKSKTLKRISDTEVIHYQTITTPWPTDNRDFVVNVKITQDQKSKVVTQRTTCIPDYIPSVKGHIRIPELKATWILTPIKPGLVNIEYRLLVDAGGNIPAGLENLAAVDGPYHTMLNLKQWVMKEKYQKSDLPFIDELQ